MSGRTWVHVEAPPVVEDAVEVFGRVTLAPGSGAVTVDGRRVSLTRTEFRLLYILAANAGRVVPTGRLIAYAWGYEPDPTRDGSLVKTHVCHLRKKAGLAITAVQSLGYRIDAAVLRASGAEAAGEAA